MRKIWNTLIYGDRKTKAYLWSIVLLIVLAVGSCVMFVITISLWWLVGVLSGLTVAAILAATVKFREIEAPERLLPEEVREPNNKKTENRKHASFLDR